MCIYSDMLFQAIGLNISQPQCVVWADKGEFDYFSQIQEHFNLKVKFDPIYIKTNIDLHASIQCIPVFLGLT